MKKLFSTLSLLAIFCVAVLAEKQVVALYVPGMECNNCKDWIITLKRSHSTYH